MANLDGGPIIGSGVASVFTYDKTPDPPRGNTDLPEGLPIHVDHPLAWTGSQFADAASCVLVLTVGNIDELEAALAHFKERGLDGTLVSRDTFPLPKLHSRLEHLRDDIHTGKGFGVIRGLSPEKYSIEDLTILHLGLQSYVASKSGRQDKKGNMMVHIKADDSSATRADHHRHSTAPITFHNEEAGDIVSWLTRNSAVSGGNCVIASAYTVYNVLAASRPDLIRVLMRSDWPFALPKFHCRPVLYQHDHRLIMNFGRTALLGSPSYPRSKDMPQLSSQQMEALNAIETIARATELEISTQPGDLHFINNLAILHRRDGFVDGDSPETKRHLVRMRLRDDELGWSIPPTLQTEWDRAFARGKPTMWHLQPMPDGFFPLRTQPN